MTTSHRARQGWIRIFWLSLGSLLVSAFYGYRQADSDVTPFIGMMTGLASSFCITTPILLFEIKAQHIAFVRRLRRQPLWFYFTFRIAVYTAIIFVGLTVARLAVIGHAFQFDQIFRDAFAFSIAMIVLANVILEIGYLVGFRTLRNLLTGRYVQPRSEQRAFLLIDMQDSTGVAERLGPIRFHRLLNDFFYDVAEAALECDAEIHKYVGDEAILTWPEGHSLEDGDVLACPFAVRTHIEARAEHYRQAYGTEPRFRAAGHFGAIVAGQIGDTRREIAYVGDTLNVAARLLEATKTVGRDVVVSTELLDRSRLPAGLIAEPLPTLSMRGRKAPLSIAALSRA